MPLVPLAVIVAAVAAIVVAFSGDLLGYKLLQPAVPGQPTVAQKLLESGGKEAGQAAGQAIGGSVLLLGGVGLAALLLIARRR